MRFSGTQILGGWHAFYTTHGTTTTNSLRRSRNASPGIVQLKKAILKGSLNWLVGGTPTFALCNRAPGRPTISSTSRSASSARYFGDLSTISSESLVPVIRNENSPLSRIILRQPMGYPQPRHSQTPLLGRLKPGAFQESATLSPDLTICSRATSASSSRTYHQNTSTNLLLA